MQANTHSVLGATIEPVSPSTDIGAEEALSRCRVVLRPEQDKGNTRQGSFQGRLAMSPMYQILLHYEALQSYSKLNKYKGISYSKERMGKTIWGTGESR